MKTIFTNLQTTVLWAKKESLTFLANISNGFVAFWGHVMYLLDAILAIIYATGSTLREIPRFKLSEKDKFKKEWIFPKEYDRYITIVCWLTNTKSLKPLYRLFFTKVERLIKSSSSTWAFAYTKEVFRLTVRALAGTPEVVSFDTPIRVARDTTGLPKIIPLKLRKVLREYMDNPMTLHPVVHTTGWLTDAAVQMYADAMQAKPSFDQKAIVGILTIMSVFRVLSTKVKPDYGSVVKPFDGFIRTFPAELMVSAMQSLFPKGMSLSIGRFKPFTGISGGPNGNVALWGSAIDALAFLHQPKVGYSLIRWMYAQHSYFYLFWFVGLNVMFGPVYLFFFFMSHATAWIFRGLHAFARISGINLVPFFSKPSIYYWFEKAFSFFEGVGRIAVGQFRGETDRLNIGKLGVVYDQAGKARVVAATNWWIQSAFSGLHDSIFKLLKSIPCDGTFDQQGAFDRFISKVAPQTTMSGFDLSSATDRLPIDLQVQVLNASGINGDLWRDILDFEWYAPIQADKAEDGTYIKYSVGQPMGALSSWAMLALTHHVIVHAAKVSSTGVDQGKALNYAVLGDDFVINDDEVASQYTEIMAALGLEIKLGKSVISTRFTEFAKQLRGPNINFSPIGPGAILSACRSGYMIPAVFMSAIGSVITTPQEVLDLTQCAPSGIVARRDLSKYMALVLWQLFNASGTMTKYVSRLGRDVMSLLNHDAHIFTDSPSPVYFHIFDSMTNLYTKEMRAKKAAAHLPMVSFLTGALPILVSKSPTLRVLETLMKPFNPGFWIFLKEAFIAPIVLDEIWTTTFETLPNGGPSVDDSFRNYYKCIIHMTNKDRRASIMELKFTKSEIKVQARYYQDLYNDMHRRYKQSEMYELHRNWYEIGY